MSGENISIFIAFIAGLLSFVSPCVLPLVPGYLGHLVGITYVGPSTNIMATDSRIITETNNNADGETKFVGIKQGSLRLLAFIHAVAFVFGFSVVFVTFWASIGALGAFLPDYIRYVRPMGGIILIVLGLNMAGIFHIAFLYRSFKFSQKPYLKTTDLKQTKQRGLPSSFFLGVIFAAGWSPCIGPVLGAIIGLASESSTALKGMYLLVFYSLGLGVPFIICALLLSQVTTKLRLLNRWLNGAGLISVVSGLLVALIGVLMLTNVFQVLPQYFNWLPL